VCLLTVTKEDPMADIRLAAAVTGLGLDDDATVIDDPDALVPDDDHDPVNHRTDRQQAFEATLGRPIAESDDASEEPRDWKGDPD